MRKKNYKGRCEKRSIPKCEGICKTYDELQSKMVDILSEEQSIKTIQCNISLEGITHQILYA